MEENNRKLFGRYYTPLKIAQFIVKYALKNNNENILEPSCGDGVFIDAINSIFSNNNMYITGVELDKNEAKKSFDKLMKYNISGNVNVCDFLDWYLNEVYEKNYFDAIIGNPPYIRFRYLNKSMQESMYKIFDVLNLKFSRYMNIWIPFILASIDLLKPGGRSGMIIPYEIFNVIYAQCVRDYLINRCIEINIIDPKNILFESTIQGTVILLLKKKNDICDISKGIKVIPINNLEEFDIDPECLINKCNVINIDVIRGKWNNIFLSEEERKLLFKIKDNNHIKKFYEIANVNVGIVTGANDFFIVNNEKLCKYDLHNLSYPALYKGSYCKGIVYSEKIHEENIAKGIPSSFIFINEKNDILNDKQKEYIALGKNNKINNRYKCRIRKDWYSVPYVYSTKIIMPKRVYNISKLIFNEIDVFVTDSMYRITANLIDYKFLVFSFINSLTALTAELEGRCYGGGVLELTPSEVEKLLIPISNINDYDLVKLNDIVKFQNPEKYIQNQDRYILGNVGITIEEQNIIFNAWLRLKNKRQRI